MKDITEERWRAERPHGIDISEALEFCLKALFSDKKKRSKDVIVPGLTYEILIGTLILAQDTATEHEQCYYEEIY